MNGCIHQLFVIFLLLLLLGGRGVGHRFAPCGKILVVNIGRRRSELAFGKALRVAGLFLHLNDVGNAVAVNINAHHALADRAVGRDRVFVLAVDKAVAVNVNKIDNAVGHAVGGVGRLYGLVDIVAVKVDQARSQPVAVVLIIGGANALRKVAALFAEKLIGRVFVSGGYFLIRLAHAFIVEDVFRYIIHKIGVGIGRQPEIIFVVLVAHNESSLFDRDMFRYAFSGIFAIVSNNPCTSRCKCGLWAKPCCPPLFCRRSSPCNGSCC